MNQTQRDSLKIVLELARLGLRVQQGLDDAIVDLGGESLPDTFPILEEEAEKSLKEVSQMLNKCKGAPKSQLWDY